MLDSIINPRTSSRELPFWMLLATLLCVVTTLTAQETVLDYTDSNRIRVVSYNIKRGLGNDGFTNLNRTADVLRKLNPDFVGLQEVDEKTQRSGNIDQAKELGLKLKMHYAFAPFMDHDGGRYGLAVLSRFPFQTMQIIKLPEGNEPRVALATKINFPSGRSVVFVNLHFDWVEDDEYRFSQATTLKKYLASLKDPYVLLGDFNDTRESRTLKLLGQGIADAKKPCADRFTFSSAKPFTEIDFIFAAPRSYWKIDNVKVVDEPLASDHRPVLVEISTVSNPL